MEKNQNGNDSRPTDDDGGAKGADHGRPADLVNDTDRMSRLLPGAIARASRHSGRLSEALRPSVIRALRITAQDEPRVLVDALFRVVVPAFARAFAERVHAWLLGLNYFVLRNASIHGFRWRLEAMRTGRSFRTIVRERTSGKRVQQVFLIHRETGLLLASARQEQVRPMDGDMISAMLTAIQDFVQDSFGVPRRAGLEHIQVGRTQVWIEQGEQAVLAGVVDGHAPAALRAVFHEALLRIHSDFQDELAHFRGDVAVFSSAQLYLDSCVNARLAETGDRFLLVTWLLLIAPVLALVTLGAAHLRDVLIWHGYVQSISRQPGIVVLESGVRRGRFFIRGLRDPLALDPAAMLPAATIRRDAVDSEWAQFQALSPEWSLLRARQMLNPPDSVELDIQGTTLHIYGAAPAQWVEDARRLARFVPGIVNLDVSRLLDADVQPKRAWQAYIEQLRSEPGIVVVESGVRDGRFFVGGLRDPAAADPVSLLERVGLNPAEVESRWDLYAAPLPRFALQRAARVLAPPPSVRLKLNGDVLVAEGEASHRWIREARLLARAVDGISRFDTQGLVDTDMSQFHAVRSEIEAVIIRFLDRSTELWPGQARLLRQLAEQLEAVHAMGRRMGVDIFVELRGTVLDARDEEVARSESLVLAQRFADILQRQDVDTRRILPRGIGIDIPATLKADSSSPPRRFVTVSLSVIEH